MIRHFRQIGFTILLLMPSLVFGQGFLENNRTDIELSTAYPEPNETVTATALNQNSSDLPGDLVWRINGDVNPAYTNERTIEFTAGDLGTPTVVQIMKNGTTLAQKLVNPAYIDIAVDPLTHTPHHYRGRAEVTPGSSVLLTALTEEATKRDPNAYTYTWEVNGRVIEGGAWDGNHRVQVPVPVGSSEMEVTVTVDRADLGTIGEKTITFPVRDTATAFYRVSSLYGLHQNALADTYQLEGDTLTLRAIPYFMANEAMAQPRSTEWRLDNQTVQSDTPFTLTVQPNRVNGQSTLSFQHYNSDNFSQQAQHDLQITY